MDVEKALGVFAGVVSKGLPVVLVSSPPTFEVASFLVYPSPRIYLLQLLLPLASSDWALCFGNRRAILVSCDFVAITRLQAIERCAMASYLVHFFRGSTASQLTPLCMAFSARSCLCSTGPFGHLHIRMKKNTLILCPQAHDVVNAHFTCGLSTNVLHSP